MITTVDRRPVTPVPPAAGPALAVEVRGLRKSYGRTAVLRDLDLTVHAGQMVGIEGENGAGKSTVLRCLVGLLRPDRGDVAVHGRLGYCPQEPTLVDTLTPQEVLRLFAAGYGLDEQTFRRRVGDLMERYGCTRFAQTRVDRLSGGTRQKVNLIAALLHDPLVLVLDEPYQGFDHDTYLTFWHHVEELRSAGGAVVVVSHMHTEQHRFNVLLRLRDGRLEPVPGHGPGTGPDGAQR